VYGQVSESADLSLNYWLELILAAGIATFGLVLNSPAVIIGAMLVSPLMGPIMGVGLALAAGDIYLGIKAVLNLVTSVTAAVVLSGFLVWLLPFHSPTVEILGRTNPNLLDLGVALLSGLAGSIVACRGGRGGGITALPGVAIAVALMPPLCTVGFGLGSGVQATIMGGAGLLFLTNLAAIVASAFLVFFLVRMDAPEVRAEVAGQLRERASNEALFRVLRHTAVSRLLGDIGKLRWRFVMMAVLLAAVFVPLRDALLQVKAEALARGVIQEELRGLAPADGLVSRQTQIGAGRIRILLIAADPIEASRLERTRENIMRRTGMPVELNVREVASREELAALVAREPEPVPPPPPPTLESLRAEILSRLEGPLAELWPADVPLLSYELGFSGAGIVLHVSYEAAEPIGDAAEQILAQGLRSRLKVDALAVSLEQKLPPRPTRNKR
jgi:uncharacterized hydrophobic protein (TIGR00271 family)